MSTPEAGGAGGAPQPVPATSGPAPAQIPEELAALLPEGFELPAGVLLIQVPERSPEEQVAGAVEHASMLRGVADAAAADLEAMRAHAEGQIAAQAEGADRCAAEADEAEARARDLAGELGVEAGPLPRHPTFAHLDAPPDTGTAGEGGDRLWRSAPTPRS